MSPLTESPWRNALRADWENRLRLAEEAIELGWIPAESLDDLRAQMTVELGEQAEPPAQYADLTPADLEAHLAAADREAQVPLGQGLAPAQLNSMEHEYVRWLDERVREGTIRRDSPVWKARLHGLLSPQRASDLAVVLFSRASQSGRDRRPGRARARRRTPARPADPDPDLDGRSRWRR